MKTCKNCGHPIDNKFCPSCGQPTSVERLNLRYLYQKFIDSFDIDRGFLWTIWRLLYKPGQTIRDYVDGNRISLYNPVKLFLITAAVQTFFTLYTGTFGGEELNSGESPWGLLGGSLPHWMEFSRIASKYFSFFSLTGTFVRSASDVIPITLHLLWYG